jgi:transporter family-2 protein
MKMNTTYFITLALAGIAVAFQAGVNGALGKQIGTIEATFTSFIVGLMFIGIVMIFFGKGNISLVKDVPLWQLLGGILGAFYVLAIIIMAQLTTSSVIDHFGIFTGVAIPINWKKISAMVLMFFSLWLFYKR